MGCEGGGGWGWVEDMYDKGSDSEAAVWRGKNKMVWQGREVKPIKK